MRNQTKKIIAPVIVVIVLIAYFALFLLLPVGFLSVIREAEGFSLALMTAFVLIPVATILCSIYVLIERIREIKKGEEDDLSKY